MTTAQEKFWQSDFGAGYIDRNNFSPEQLDEMYRQRYGVSRREMNREFLSDLAISSVLEVGANIGNQLVALASDWPKWELNGIEINGEAVREAQARLPKAKIIQGSAFALPYIDEQFDLVFTSGVLIHIHPDDLPMAMAEIFRVTKKYILGFEYYAPTLTPITYRGNQDRLWKNDFADRYQTLFPNLKLVKEKHYSYRENPNLTDSMFLLGLG